MSMIDERIIVGHDILERHILTFSVVAQYTIPPSEEGDAGQTDYVVCLARGNTSVTWCQGYEDLDYDYFNEYKDKLV